MGTFEMVRPSSYPTGAIYFIKYILNQWPNSSPITGKILEKLIDISVMDCVSPACFPLELLINGLMKFK